MVLLPKEIWSSTGRGMINTIKR